jgi:hypothetical protein
MWVVFVVVMVLQCILLGANLIPFNKKSNSGVVSNVLIYDEKDDNSSVSNILDEIEKEKVIRVVNYTMPNNAGTTEKLRLLLDLMKYNKHSLVESQEEIFDYGFKIKENKGKKPNEKEIMSRIKKICASRGYNLVLRTNRVNNEGDITYISLAFALVNPLAIK